MAQFCTQCGTPADADARFCDGCGAIRQARPASRAAADTIPAPPRRLGKRALAIAGGIGAGFALLGGLAILTRDEPASEAAFTRAINRYYEQTPAAASKLLCVGNLQLEADPVQLNEFESQRRALMDGLAAAGLYTPADVQVSGNFFSLRTYRYHRTAEGARAIKDGKLCLAPALHVTQVRYRPEDRGAQIVASFRYDFSTPAPWLKDELAQRLRRSSGQEDEHSAVLALQNGQWTMVSDERSAARRASSLAALPQPTLMQRVQSWFRTGNPLIGQWRVTNSPWLAGITLRFDVDQAAVGRPSEAVRYELKGDAVTVRYLNRQDSDVFYIQDNDHISIASDAGLLQLERIKNNP